MTEATAEHTVAKTAAKAAPPPQKVTAADSEDRAPDATNGAAPAPAVGKAVHPDGSVDLSGHVTFLPVPEAEKLERSKQRKRWREPLYTLPCGELFELPGRPHVCWCLRNYGDDTFGSPEAGAKCAREDFNFLFKAFESGQLPPHRLKKDDKTEVAPTIHQYLDWTVTASTPKDIDDVDFGGFRTILLFPTHKPEYPPPGTYTGASPPSVPGLGCEIPPLPALMVRGCKPVSVATIRVGDGYLEVPFFATSDNHRGKGYGHCLLEAIETVARQLRLSLLLLCSTDDDKVRGFWHSCGFEYTNAVDVARWRVCQGDLIYMTNTVQMHKPLPPKRSFEAFLLVHGAFVHRLYAPLDAPRGAALQALQDWEDGKARRRAPPAKAAPAKGAPRGGSASGELQRSITPPQM